MPSSSHVSADGFRFETHWYENVVIGERVGFRTKFPDGSNVGDE
jgi:hypothetical protein